VEAGLRTDNLAAPFPEEANRQLISRIASLHLAPTPGAAAALRRECLPIPEVHVTGNTVVDALQWMVTKLPADGAPPPPMPGEAAADLSRFTDPRRRVVLITGHRRESFSGGLVAVCGGIARLAGQFPETDFVYPVHLNPAVQKATAGVLGGLQNVHLIAPVGYARSVWLVRRSTFVITDSGGLQEEAPALGKPVLVTRESTERPEGVEAGCALLIGYDVEALVARASEWLADPAALARHTPQQSPYGDGLAGLRVVAAVRRRLGLATQAVEAWP
ncbi:MAG: non-hydrolyzing UDP-N-acetylglucosamine 2-epimerase, partial [Nannocystaceae bacterium]